jgi:hypothetical protein
LPSFSSHPLKAFGIGALMKHPSWPWTLEGGIGLLCLDLWIKFMTRV